MKLPVRMLFLCTGNSCRSIIAEALANHLGAGKLQAFSAGSFPTGKVNDNALAVLARHGVPVGEPSSQSWNDYEDVPLDIAVTVCDAAAGESCPLWLGDTVKAHWGVADPAHVEGCDEEIARAFERTFAEMKARVNAMLELPLDKMSDIELAAAMGDIQRRFAAAQEH